MKKIKMESSGKMRTVPISELLEQRIEFQTITNNTPLLAFTIAEGVINPEDKKSNKRDFLIKDKDNKRFELTEKDDIIYNPANVVFGAIHRNALGKGVVSPIYKIFKCVNVDPLYMDCVVSRASFIHELSKYAEGSVTKLRTLAPESFLNLELTVPTDVDEQHKIGILIESLKTRIENEKKQTEKLKALRASMLDKMFPKEGKTEPEIRFDGFADAWKQRKLSSLCEKFTDGDWIESEDQSDSGVRLIQTGNVGVAEYLDKPNNKKWISDETFDRLHCEEVLPGDILISRLPEPAGRACIMPSLGTKMITAVDCAIVRTSPDVSNKFLVQYLSSQPYFNEVNTCLAGGTRQRISRSNLSNFMVPIPSEKDEQDAIGSVFENLDNLITLHQRKYEKLIDTKKAFLEKLIGGEK
jgi:type I restriction enzyme S subunit